MKRLNIRTVKNINKGLFLMILLFLLFTAVIWISTAAPAKRKNFTDNVNADIAEEFGTEQDFEQQYEQQNYETLSGFKISENGGLETENGKLAADTAKDVEFIFPDSYREELSESEIKKLNTVEEVQGVINYIYARCGCIFGDEERQNYFEKFDWYEGRNTVQDMNQNPLDYMTEVQYQNIQILAKRRSELQ